MSYSQTLLMTAKARELKAQGKDVISLSIGSPDFRPPDFVLDAAKDAIDGNFHDYSPVPGYLDLRQAICNKFKRDNALDYKLEQIVVSNGGKQSIINLFLALINPGDQVLMPSPYWVSYYEMTKLVEGEPVVIQTDITQDFKITPAQLEAAITSKTKIFIFSSPCNPSGSVYSKGELSALAEVFAKHPQVIIISDEIYEHINYMGKHESIAQFESVYNQTVTLNGMSKAFAMTGWRVGYIGAPLWLAKACDKVQGQLTSGANSIAQRATLAALEASPDKIKYMIDAFKQRRDLVVSLLRDIPGFVTNVPEGAFYTFPDVSYYFGKKLKAREIKNADDLAICLLDEAHVATVSGEAFGNSNCIRISYAASKEQLQTALFRIKQLLTSV